MKRFVGILSLSLLVIAPLSVHAAPLLSNGDFSGGLASWTTANSGTGIDTFVTFIAASPGGPTDPIADSGVSGGPAARVLFQDFLVPVGGVSAASFTFDFYSTNPFPLATTPSPITVTGADLFRVDVVDPAAPVFTAPSLLALFVDPGGIFASPTSLAPLAFPSPPALTAFLNANAGDTLRLRIGHVESNFPWGTGVDNVSLDVTPAAVDPIPEPSSLALLGMGSFAFVAYGLRRRKQSEVVQS